MSRTLIATALVACLGGAQAIAAEMPAAEVTAAKPAAIEIGVWKVAVTIPQPAVIGKALDVDLLLTPATTAPKAVRLWVGKGDARGSTKVKAEAEAAGAYCVGVEIPDPLPVGSQVWIALEAADGTVSKGAVALP